MSAAPGAAHPAITPTPDPALIDACVHCGFCLPACPTYLLEQEEMDSPRGRIYLMRAAATERTPVDATYVQHFDRCLGCLACVTACPSGVQYGTLITSARHQIEETHRRPIGERIFREVIFALFPHPRRLRVAFLPLVLWQRIAPLARQLGLTRLLSRRLRAMLDVAPQVSLASLYATTPVDTPAQGTARHTVGLLTGCVQRVAFGHVNDATRRVLSAEGCRVVAPAAQRCCGALSLHAGRLDEARAAARHTIETFERAGVDLVVTNAAGCGSAMKEYGALLADDPAWAERAERFRARARDVSELLAELGPVAPRHPLRLRVAYQDACHLAHAQGIRREPRHVLAEIPELTVVTPPDADLCCGSAGIYNLLEVEAAASLGSRKAEALASTSPDVVASANPGCALQIAAASRRAGRLLRVVHPIELVDASIRGVRGPTG